MTEKEYYLWSNRFNNLCILASAAVFFTKIYIASFVFELSYSKQNVKCKLQMKTIKNEIGIWGVWIWPHWNVLLSFPKLQGHKYKQKVLSLGSITALYWLLLWRKYIPVYWPSYDNSFDNLKPWYAKRIAKIFSFCWLVATWIFQLLSHKYSFRNYRNSFSTAKWSFPKYRTKKKPKNLSLFNCKYNVSSSITPIPNIGTQGVQELFFCVKCWR